MQQDSVCSTWMPSCEFQGLPIQSATVELAAINNEMILSDKWNGLENSTRKRKSSKTSDQDSTSNEKDFLPYWNDSCAATSSVLWLPIETALQGSESMPFDISSRKMAENSWFSIRTWKPTSKPNSLPIYSPSYITSLAECADSEVMRAKRIRLYPTPAQKNCFKRWFGTSRKVYNLTVEHLNLPKEDRQKHWMGAAKQILPTLPEWAKEIPYQVKKIAVEDAYKNVLKWL